MKRTYSMLALTLTMLLASPAAAETLNNDTILTLIAAGVPEEAIIAKIKASDAAYDLSTDQIIALKGKGVTGPIIAAMLDRSAPKSAAPVFSTTSPDPLVPHPTGVYLLQDWLPEPAMQRIDPTVSNQAKTGGFLGYAFTGGLASLSVKAVIPNPTARVHASASKPTFFLFFDESNPGTASGGSWLAGTATTITSPNELTLVRLVAKNGRREARVGSVNIAGAKTGVMDRDQLAFDYEAVRPGVYKVTPRVVLSPGEYGFIYSLTGGATGGAITARIFDFSVK
jgi:hypothetical protein